MDFITEGCTRNARSNLKILIADDERVLLHGLRKLFERMGHDVDVVPNGLEAIEAVGRRGYDLILLDLQMPYVGGIEVARFLAETRPRKLGSWVVAMSGDTASSLVLSESGFDRFLAKPIRFEQLLKLASEIQLANSALS